MATPTYATVISQINTYIVANGNNEITANVLNPVLKVITDFANNTIGNLATLTTTDTDTIVGAINSLKTSFDNLNNNGVQLLTGYDNPNVTPPPVYKYADFYMELDITDDNPIQLWQWSGTEWNTYSNVYSKTEIDLLLSNTIRSTAIIVLDDGIVLTTPQQDFELPDRAICQNVFVNESLVTNTTKTAFLARWIQAGNIVTLSKPTAINNRIVIQYIQT